MDASTERDAEKRPSERDPSANRLARGFLALAVIAGVLIFVDIGGAVTTLAKGLFFVFVVLSLYYVSTTTESDSAPPAPRGRSRS